MCYCVNGRIDVQIVVLHPATILLQLESAAVAHPPSHSELLKRELEKELTSHGPIISTLFASSVLDVLDPVPENGLHI